MVLKVAKLSEFFGAFQALQHTSQAASYFIDGPLQLVVFKLVDVFSGQIDA